MDERISTMPDRHPRLFRLADHTIFVVEEIGRIAKLLGGALAALPSLPRSRRLVVDQMVRLGLESMPLVVVISIFTGAVAAWQAAYQFQGWVPLRYLGEVIGKNVVVELGPVLTSLVVAGRISAAMAAELGTMRVTEQIDALEAMGISPSRYLVMPRFVSATVMLPVAVIFADALAIAGAFLVSNLLLDVSAHTYTMGLRRIFQVRDVVAGLEKAAVFGMFMALMGCHFGMRAEGGAQGVGRATTLAVVTSCVCVLILDYFLTTFLFPIAGV
ncbi:MAG TPA: ABC transporter permease [Candidatus Saccharimonadales bacterium]|nr:ABC transporter permease [Candidatus Saccharimonadales bacterium]